MKDISAIIKGKVPSKSNSYLMRVDRLRRPVMYKSTALVKYEDNFLIQFPPKLRNLNISKYFEITVDVFYPSNRSDLDNSLKIILDCLQNKTKTIKNDNKCIKIIAQKAVDKLNPRVEIKLKFIK